MDNGMQNMLEMFIFETSSLLDELDSILLAAEKDGTFSTDDVNEVFRIMHTIKGSSAMMQFNSMSVVAHNVENLFYFIRENGGHEAFGHDLFNVLFQASDFLKLQIENIQNNEPISDDAGDLISRIESLLKRLQGGEGPETEEKKPEEQAPASGSRPELKKEASAEGGSGKKQYTIRVFFDEDVGMENLRAFMLVSSVKEACPGFAYEPENVETDNTTAAEIVENGFLMHFDTKESLNKAISIVKSALNIRTYEVLESTEKVEEEVLKKTGAEADGGAAPKKSETGAGTPANTASAPAGVQVKKDAGASHVTAGKQSLISVNLTKLDNLMAIVGEIVITESMVTSNPDLQGLKLDNFTKSARQLRKLTDDLQDTVMSIRMVPVSGVFQKMNRIVRDMSQSLGKPARLVTVGADTEVDKTIVDSIGDPIMHMVRNSMDHGLEDSPEERIAAGKPAEGTVTLTAKHTGSEIIITIEDDGRGVNIQKVLEKAKRQNMLTKPESEYSQREILQFLLMPGFSTNEAVTEYSGRGVGMDVVKKNMEKIGGIITMSTEEGEGTCTTLKIPLTLAIVDGMEIAVGKSIFTVPIHNIRQSFKVTKDDIIYDAAGGEMIRRMDEFYPVLRIHELFHISTKATEVEDGIMMWVEASDKSYCLYADELLGEQQVVVKPLPTYLNSFNIKDSGITGCTILGDGNISIILDILYLYEASLGR